MCKCRINIIVANRKKGPGLFSPEQNLAGMAFVNLNNMRIFIPFLVGISILFSCGQTDIQQEPNAIKIRTDNLLDSAIDTLKFEILIPDGTDTLLYTSIPAQGTSSWKSINAATYFFKEESDVFLISEGKFVINGESYFLSNCFCDPVLQKGDLPFGEYIIFVEEIDPLRKNVNYTIKRR